MDDVQEILLTMRKEQREDHGTLCVKVDEGFHSLEAAISEESLKRHAHEKDDLSAFAAFDARLKTVESLRKTLRWIGAAAITAFLAGAADAFFHHVK